MFFVVGREHGYSMRNNAPICLGHVGIGCSSHVPFNVESSTLNLLIYTLNC